jgi:Mrp family chromosome partitioning ATPase
VIAEALPPQHKSNIRGIYIIAGAGALGGLLAVAGLMLWRAFDRRIVTPEAASASTGVPCLGIIPPLSAEPVQPIKPSQPATKAGGKNDVAAKTKGKQAADEGEAAASKFAIHSPLATYAVDHPSSELSRTLRNVQAASQDCFGGKGLRSIAVTSTYAGEGRSTVAANFALSLAASGKSVLLIDSDASDPGLSRRFSDGQRPGLIDYLEKDEAQLSKYLLIEERTGLRFLPIGGPGVRNGGMIWTKRLERLLVETVAYDYVIFDAPTLSDQGDIRASARYLDAFVLVIGWNKVSSDSIHVGMDSAGSVSERLLGTVLNNVEAKSARWMLSPQAAFIRRQRI